MRKVHVKTRLGGKQLCPLGTSALPNFRCQNYDNISVIRVKELSLTLLFFVIFYYA